ncbi:MAG: hypothetical protein M3Z16_12355 [Pseudomonadota bacterium]|nr:hypothetical protein [Pseudomonadota bacterium]
MSKDLFSAVLTFVVLLGGSAAIGSELLRPVSARATLLAVQTLPAVVVTGKRAASTAVASEHVVAQPTQIR